MVTPLDPTYCIPVGRPKLGSEKKVPIKFRSFDFTRSKFKFNLVGLKLN